MDGPTVAWMREQAAKLGRGGHRQRADPRRARGFSTGCCGPRPTASCALRQAPSVPHGEGTRALRRRSRPFDGRTQGLAHLPAGLLRPALPGVHRATASTSSARTASTTTCWCSSANWPSPRRLCLADLAARARDREPVLRRRRQPGRLDGNDLHYTGDSVALDELGRPLLECGAQVQVATVRFSAEALARHRENFPAQMDADSFELRD